MGMAPQNVIFAELFAGVFPPFGAYSRPKLVFSGMIRKPESTNNFRCITGYGAVPEPFTLVLFGASGDLAQRMIMPAIFRLARRGLLSPEFCLVGYARSKMTDDEFRARMRKGCGQTGG